MTTTPGSHTRAMRILRRGIIFVLAGLLVFYHAYTLCDVYVAGHGTGLPWFDAIQSVLRVNIAVSLIFVMLGRRWALPWMWASIGSLVATQYWAHFGELPVEFTAGRHALSYLKGFIFPTIITLSFQAPEASTAPNGPSPNPQRTVNPSV